MRLGNAYRRGTILGLTLAELFILLTFIALLWLIGLEDKNDTISEELQSVKQEMFVKEQALSVMEQERSEWADVIEFRTPDEIKTLMRVEEETRERLAAMDAMEQRMSEMSDEIKTLMQAGEVARARLSVMEQENISKKLEHKKQMAQKQEELQQAQRGERPPCWYQVVEEGGKSRESAHYTFNIAVYEEKMVVQRLQAPPGRAVNDVDKNDLSYAEEAKRLNLDSLTGVYDTCLTDDELRTALSPIVAQGKQRKVRSYSCLFYVRVWDKTSLSSKTRWKQAFGGTLQGLFGTFDRVGDKKWTGPSCH